MCSTIVLVVSQGNGLKRAIQNLLALYLLNLRSKSRRASESIFQHTYKIRENILYYLLGPFNKRPNNIFWEKVSKLLLNFHFQIVHKFRVGKLEAMQRRR